ncbi:Ig-like domain-containing protein [Sulfurovum mangrovi]|uniref:Ig-like domain-containing protein n=1 Tax=Sulfurovum mangrovi TaxID=2893889 RepID=UPI001E2ACF79|nr:Ig-like domain-containing protein [Sulfurovum mangrovi]UFH58899.1 Ig-like domain-containing protein [Sulfurovum mangrovi]
MGKEITIIVKEGQDIISSNSVIEGSGKPLVIKAKSGQSYELKNMTEGVAPDQIYVVRDGNNLKIKIGKKTKHAQKSDQSDEAADIIIEEYFEHDCSLIGLAENGQYYNFIPQGADPAASYYSLGGETLVAETETDWLPIILGTLGAGAIAAAAGGGGGGGGDATAPDKLTVTLTDDEAPIEGEITSGTETNDTTPIISGTTEPGATVTAKDDGGNLLGTATADNEGNYTITPNKELNEGPHHILVTAEDAAGNDTTVSSVIFTVDTTAPNPPELEPTDGSPIIGTSEPGSTVTISYNDGTGIVTETTTADDYGNFIFTPDTPVPDGTVISATAKDAAGNQSLPGTTIVNAALVDAPIVYDDVAPLIGLVSDGDTTNDARPEFKGVLDPANAGSTIEVFDGATSLGTTTVESDGSWSLTPTSNLAEGDHTITYTKDGGSASPATSFTIDTVDPTITMTLTDNEGDETGPISNNSSTDDATPTVSGKTEPDATVTIKDGDTVLGTVMADGSGNYTFTPPTPLEVGLHTISATATDEAGNTDTTSTTFTIEPPAVIDLGDDGQLINPVYVDGKYYYYWDKDGDGEGIINLNPDGDDMFTHDELDAIFIYDENGNERPADLDDTTDTYRYAELGGYQVALPTFGADTYGVQNATEIDNNPSGEINPYYDDLVAIWDAFEGGTNLTPENGTPPEWANGEYWSSTQFDETKHYSVDMTSSLVGTNGEHETNYVAVEVIL